MRNVKRAVLLVISLVIMFGVVIFTLENQQPTGLIFLGWHSPELPQAFFFIGALLMGMAVGPLMGFIAYKRKAGALKRRLLTQL
ncbi:alkaline shock response membrane anchor protein AmaP [Pseudomonas fragi]|uniref:alkaline shock response membrane anchor protein AmaP n=1 Tax=Pseudomonas fragi TaxID=296 RepID=UPI0020065913|nr:alkaline shock response membrane anchor protein AmaP [Pseudomonas fragi]MCK6251381.1 DUF1049 domain-containing protein [Pseudomonas fragi]